MIIEKQVVIIGGGPAGLAAAVELKKRGVDDIIVLEREKHLGGILRQCIHDGFGLTRFQKSLSGPEYAQIFIDEAEKLQIPIITDITVTEITPDKIVKAVSSKGLCEYKAKAVVLTMGCRERTRGALTIPGTRPSGVMTAGVAQAYINLHNIMIGKEAVILGSGDIGLIMARRMTLEGIKVKAVFEIQPYPSGLSRNIQQCLNDYGIPLYLSHTVTEIKGESRLTSVVVAEVDENRVPIKGTEKEYSCDALVLSVGLIPENEVALTAGVELDKRTGGAFVDENCQTCVDGIFAAGNALQVHDLVDFVSMEAEKLGASVAEYLEHGASKAADIEITAGESIGYCVPQKTTGGRDFTISLRVRKPLDNCEIAVRQKDKVIRTLKMKKALPAEMIHIEVDKGAIIPGENMEVAVV